MNPDTENAITVIENGTVYYYDSRDADKPTRHEGKAEIHANWVRLRGSSPAWVPRELVEKVLEI